LKKYVDAIWFLAQFILLLHIARWIYNQLPAGTIPLALKGFFSFIIFGLLFAQTLFVYNTHHDGYSFQWSTAIDGCLVPPENLYDGRYSENEILNAERLVQEDLQLKKSVGKHRSFWWIWENPGNIARDIAKKNRIRYE
jgi:hypothetical protein